MGSFFATCPACTLLRKFFIIFIVTQYYHLKSCDGNIVLQEPGYIITMTIHISISDIFQVIYVFKK